MASAIAWISENWMKIAVVVLLVDQNLIAIFPKVPFFVSIKNFLTGAGVKSQ